MTPLPAHAPDACHTGPGVRVAAPARLHLGFLDPDATLGRRWGSLGLCVEGFETVVALRLAEADHLSAAAGVPSGELDRAAAHLDRLRQHWPATRRQALALHLAQTLPPHAGFGSGTQLALAMGRAYAELMGLPTDETRTPQLAQALSRGLRSGIGIAAFDQGGLLLDGGPSDAADHHRIAPLLARLALPGEWRIVLALDPQQAGLSGHAERQALQTLPPFPQADAAAICHETLMRVLPGAATDDFAAFAAGLNRIQALLGEHFAPAQPDGAYTSPAVGRLMRWLALHHQAAVGQSSWGPTGFAFFASAAAAEAACTAAREAGQTDTRLALHVVSARNEGARVARLG